MPVLLQARWARAPSPAKVRILRRRQRALASPCKAAVAPHEAEVWHHVLRRSRTGLHNARAAETGLLRPRRNDAIRLRQRRPHEPTVLYFCPDFLPDLPGKRIKRSEARNGIRPSGPKIFQRFRRFFWPVLPRCPGRAEHKGFTVFPTKPRLRNHWVAQ